MAGYSNPTSSTQSVYSLPVLSRPEIVGILAEYQIISLSESDLTNPNPDFVANLYNSFLHFLDSLEEDSSQVDFEALERFENPEIYADAIRPIKLYRRIKDVLSEIGCPISFTFPDLISPDSSRTVKESKFSMITPYAEELGILEEECKQREAKILQLRKESAALNEARDKEKPLVQEAEAKVKELQQKLDNLNSLQFNLRKEHKAMKEKTEELENNVTRSEYELIQATQENATLRSKIVHSPDKLQRTLEEKKLVQMEANDSGRLAFQSFQEKTAILEVYTKALLKMTKQLGQMQAIQEQVNSAKSVEKDVKQLKAKLSDDQMLEKSLEAKVVENQAKAGQSDKQKLLLEKEAKLRREDDTRGWDNAKLEAVSRKHYLETRGRKIEAVEAEVASIEAKIKSTKGLAAATQEELLKEAEKIVNELKLYTSRTAQVMSKMEVLQNTGPGSLS
ncbi:kinetochore protein NUF2 homolog isoform X2 [Spinacia oleracea]|uniref:Kinetochore protein NUF2 homolog isoform X2 n=1 Tax=Spinacia oleracea TaxID=3562 RepID=A0A9R0JEJ0_SPIOL|nr:kinetochore protein NUF2 homolog isoform X2 [Spinacia oleracea]